MNKEKIKGLHEKLSNFYPTLNRWGCWLFAYAFVSRVGWEWLRCWTCSCWDIESSWNVAKNSSSNHFLVKYEWMIFDWHNFREEKSGKVVRDGRSYKIQETFDKKLLALWVLEWWWNEDFYQTNYMRNGGNNMWDVIRTFLSDFEGLLDLSGVTYSSWL